MPACRQGANRWADADPPPPHRGCGDIANLAAAEVSWNRSRELGFKQALFEITMPVRLTPSSHPTLLATHHRHCRALPGPNACRDAFFNPVPVMTCGGGPRPEDCSVGRRALAVIARRMARAPVVCADSPVFIVNHIAAPMCRRQPASWRRALPRPWKSIAHERSGRHAHGAVYSADRSGGRVRCRLDSLWRPILLRADVRAAANPEAAHRGRLYGQSGAAGMLTRCKPMNPRVPTAAALPALLDKPAPPDCERQSENVASNARRASGRWGRTQRGGSERRHAGQWRLYDRIVQQRLEREPTIALDPSFDFEKHRTLMVAPGTRAYAGRSARAARLRRCGVVSSPTAQVSSPIASCAHHQCRLPDRAACHVLPRDITWARS